MQAVKAQDASLTSFRSLNKRVPQGSVLGLWPFVLLIGDIASGLDPGVHHIVFVDGLLMYFQDIIAEGRFAKIE